MKQFIRLIAVLLLSACLAQCAVTQDISGKGFIPDENGTNLDDPQSSKTIQQKVGPGTIIKDCPECPEMVVLPSGSFLMGSPDPGPDPFSNEKPKAIGTKDEKPQHRVQILSFAIGKYEVTQEQWYAVMGNNPSENKGRSLPVEQVSWDEVRQFISKLNQKTGKKYRLPSEAEWEYAARAGSTTTYPFGDSDAELRAYAWFSAVADKTNPVGLKRPNQFGLFDMLGNVWKWTEDCWHDNYWGAPLDGRAWDSGCTVSDRLLRGGSWFNESAYFRVAFRIRFPAQTKNSTIGFRLAL